MSTSATPVRSLLHLASLLILFGLIQMQPADAQSVDAAVSSLKSRQLQSVSPVRFTENRGQITDAAGDVRPDILYKAESKGVSLYFTRQGVSYVFSRIEGDMARYLRHDCVLHQHGDEGEDHHSASEGPPAESPVTRLYRMDLELVGSNPHVEVVADAPDSDLQNFYLGHQPAGITGVRSFRKLIYRDVYPNIDLVINATEHGTKSDFVVRPGGRVADIRFRYVASDRVEITPKGTLRVSNPLGSIEESAPYVYQGESGRPNERKVRASFKLKDGLLGFSLGTYDPSRTLVIDPQLIWSTFYGGTGTENLNGGDPTEVDRQGNIFIAGHVSSNTFPFTPGAFQVASGGGMDAFLVKFNSRGQRLWATYYGGSGSEIAHGVCSDKNGDVFMTGHTESSNLFTTTGAHDRTLNGTRDAFIAKLDPLGTMLWSTYVGGTSFDDGYSFAVDSSDNVAVLVTTGSLNLGTEGSFCRDKPSPEATTQSNTALYDILLAKFNSAGTQLWATYYGGSAVEYGYAAASDINDNIIFTGWTGSTNFPTLNAHQAVRGGNTDAFAVKFDRDGNRKWATYYGGASTENSGFGTTGYSGMATDDIGNIFITGTVASPGGFPVTSSAFQTTFQGGTSDAFIVKFDTLGVRQWATYAGGSGNDIGTGAASNTLGGVLITGYTNGSLPATALPLEPAFQTSNAGNNDAFIMKLDKDGAKRWITFFGGSSDDQGHGISYDPYGAIIISGHTSSDGFPFNVARSPSEPPAQGTRSSGYDAFVAVFCDPSPPEIDSSGPTTFCHDQNLTLSIEEGYTGVGWYRNTEPAPFSSANSILITESGEYYVKVESTGGCPAVSAKIKVKKLDRPNPTIAPVSPFCTGDSANLVVGGGPYATYRWKKDGTLIPSATTAMLKVKQGGIYRVIVTDAWGCPDSTEQTVIEYPMPAPISVTPADTIEICEGDPPVQLTAIGGGGGTIQWSTGAGGSSISVSQQGLYSAKSVTANNCFTTSNKVYVKVNPKPPIKILNILPLEFCAGDSTVLIASPGTYTDYTWSTGERTTQITVKESKAVWVTVTDAKGCRNRAEVTVTRFERPTPRIVASGPLVLCEGESVTLRVEGGSFQTVRWSNGATGVTTQVSKAGKYFATAANGAQCDGTSDTVVVTVNPKPVVAISGSLEVCTNSSEVYSVPAQPDVTYQWSVSGSGASIVSGAATNTITVKWGPAGNGTVRITAINRVTTCTATSTIPVVIGSALVPSITENRSPRLCPGDSITLDAGAGYTSYRWSNGAATRTITVNAAGSFSVTVENAGGCSGTSKPFVVTVTDGPKPSITASRSTTLCPGDTVYLTTSEAYDDYSWSGGQSINRIAVWSAGQYSVTVTDSNGCSATSLPVTVSIAAPPAPVVSGPASVCINSEGAYSVADVPGDSYQWSVSGGTPMTSLAGRSIRVQWPTAGTHALSLTQRSGATGCQTTVEYGVEVGTSLHPLVSANKSTLICDGDSIELSADEGYASYAWENGMSGRSIVVSEAGTYRVTVTDAGGCSGVGEIVVTRKLPLDAGVTPSGRTGICTGDSILLEAKPGFSSYLWSTGESTRSIYVKSAGEYTVTVSDADGCTGASSAVEIFIHPAIAPPQISAVGDTLLAEFQPSIAPGSMSYQWYLDDNPIGGANDDRYYTQVVGAYRVRATDSNGCSVLSAAFSPTGVATATVALPDLTAAPGERVVIPLTMTESENLDRLRATRFAGELRFSKSLLVLADPRFSSRIDGDDQVVSIEGDRATLMSSGELLSVEFIAALGSQRSTALELTTFEWTNSQSGSVVVQKRSGSFSVEDICVTGGDRLVSSSGEAAIKGVRPNPTSGVTEIEYEVNEDGHTELLIVDLLGREVMRVVSGEIEAGRYVVKLDAGKLSSGTYLCVLQTPTVRLHRMLQVEK